MASSVTRTIDAVERHFGKGPSLTREQRALVSEGVVPVWLPLGANMLDGEIGDRCRRAIEVLVELRRKLAPKIEFPQEGDSE